MTEAAKQDSVPAKKPPKSKLGLAMIVLGSFMLALTGILFVTRSGGADIIVFAIIGLGGILLGIRQVMRSGRRKSKNAGQDGEGEDAESNAYVIDEAEGGGFEHLEEKDIPQASFTRNFRGQDVHLLLRDRGGVLTLPDIDEKITDGETPNDLFEALEDKDSPQAFCTPDNPAKGAATKALFITAGVLLFVLFMVWGASLGR